MSNNRDELGPALMMLSGILGIISVSIAESWLIVKTLEVHVLLAAALIGSQALLSYLFSKYFASN